MADYLPTNTARLKVHQTGPRGSHHILFRIAPGETVGTAITEVRSILTAAGPFFLAGTTFDSAEAAVEGSEVFLPAVWGTPLEVGTVITAENTDEFGRYIRFEAKSTAGARVSWTFFNVLKSTGTANNRLTSAEQSDVANTIAALNAAGGILCAIDQLPFVCKGYANTGINDHVGKRSRIFA